MECWILFLGNACQPIYHAGPTLWLCHVFPRASTLNTLWLLQSKRDPFNLWTSEYLIRDGVPNPTVLLFSRSNGFPYSSWFHNFTTSWVGTPTLGLSLCEPSSSRNLKCWNFPLDSSTVQIFLCSNGRDPFGISRFEPITLRFLAWASYIDILSVRWTTLQSLWKSLCWVLSRSM